MALMTPRGLKIRLDLDRAFALIARLWHEDPRTDAFRVLKTVEAIEHVPAVLGLVVGVSLARDPSCPLWHVATGVIIGKLVGVLLMRRWGLAVLRPFGILHLARIWSYLPGIGEVHGVVIAVLWPLRGWWIAPAWLAGQIGGAVLREVLEFCYTLLRYRLTGQALTVSELSFFSAYRLHARALGLPLDTAVSDAELQDTGWSDCLADYAQKWPEAVDRFPLTGRDIELLLRAKATEG